MNMHFIKDLLTFFNVLRLLFIFLCLLLVFSLYHTFVSQTYNKSRQSTRSWHKYQQQEFKIIK